jgi:Kef-type K+ transport system membrane component KefB
MLILLISVEFFGLSAESELPNWLNLFLEARYSEESFFLPLFICFIVCLIVQILFSSINFSSKEKRLLGKAYSLVSYTVSNLFMFFAGVLFAWSFGSRLIVFVSPIPAQEIMIPIVIAMAIASNYFFRKLKYNNVRS